MLYQTGVLLVLISCKGLSKVFEEALIYQDFQYCPALACTKNNSLNEVELWDCVANKVFEPIHDPRAGRYLEIDCGFTGWGNTIRGLISAVSLSVYLGRRLLIKYEPFMRSFYPPYKRMMEWDYGLRRKLQIRDLHSIGPDFITKFTFGEHARTKKNVQEWESDLQQADKVIQTYHDYTILQSGSCSPELSLILYGACTRKALPYYTKCFPKLLYNVAGIPFFYMLFKRPTALLVKNLSKIRQRLSLPQVNASMHGQPNPLSSGLLGLRTPGYYIFALHIRGIPKGFEPLSFDIHNDHDSRRTRRKILRNFWLYAEQNAKHARSLASCRQNQNLLIYVATDDISTYRPMATKLLSQYGRVVWGLEADEVGHMTAQWTAADVAKYEEAKMLLHEKNKKYMEENDYSALNASLEIGAEGESERYHREEDVMPEDHLVDARKTAPDIERYADMAMAEWWILANSHWLMSHIGSSYGDTAATYGLGPSGVMERFDYVNDAGVETSRRLDWREGGRREGRKTAGDCAYIGAADYTDAKNCPNE